MKSNCIKTCKIKFSENARDKNDLGLGDLAQLTVNNDSEVAYDVSFPLQKKNFMEFRQACVC